GGAGGLGAASDEGRPGGDQRHRNNRGRRDAKVIGPALHEVVFGQERHRGDRAADLADPVVDRDYPYLADPLVAHGEGLDQHLVDGGLGGGPVGLAVVFHDDPGLGPVLGQRVPDGGGDRLARLLAGHDRVGGRHDGTRLDGGQLDQVDVGGDD